MVREKMAGIGMMTLLAVLVWASLVQGNASTYLLGILTSQCYYYYDVVTLFNLKFKTLIAFCCVVDAFLKII